MAIPSEALRREQILIARRMIRRDPQHRRYWREMLRKARRSTKGGGR